MRRQDAGWNRPLACSRSTSWPTRGWPRRTRSSTTTGARWSNCCRYRNGCRTSRACPRSNGYACRPFELRCCAKWIGPSSFIASWSPVTPRPNRGWTWVGRRKPQVCVATRAPPMPTSPNSIRNQRRHRCGWVWAEALAVAIAEALAAFAEAERLYREASNIEGETEVLLRRELAQEERGDLRAARADLERAMALTQNSRSAFQQIRAQLALSRVTASQGLFGEAETLASAGVKRRWRAVSTQWLLTACGPCLHSAATGPDVEARGTGPTRAPACRQRGARRITARARLQLASWQQGRGGRPRRWRSSLGAAVRAEQRYRLFELIALQIAVRAHQSSTNSSRRGKIRRGGASRPGRSRTRRPSPWHRRTSRAS